MKPPTHDLIQRLIELAGLEDRLAAVRSNREEQTNVNALMESLRANVPMAVLMAHDRMRSKGKDSVAEVRNGVCSGCHIAVALGNMQRLKIGTLHRCGNCGRFLYIAEEAEEERGQEASLPLQTRRKSSTAPASREK